MSHDEQSGPATRKERRKSAPRYTFSAADHVDPDLDIQDLADSLERRARGYNGLLRQLLCTAAAQLRALRQEADTTIKQRDELLAAYKVGQDELKAVFEDLAGESI
jgi:hypothetical protein